MKIRPLVRWVRVSGVFAAALAAVTAGFSFAPATPPAAAAAGATTITIEGLPSPAGANSAEPQITMQGDRVILSWLEVTGERSTLKFAERTASGWSAPQTAASGANFYVNSFDVPAVRVLADGTLVANWLLTNGPDPDASNVRLAWSKDGKTWSAPVSPHHDGTKTGHGFVSTFPAPSGAAGAAFGVVWLDRRLTNPEEDTGNTSLRASTYDRAGKQLGEKIVDPRVCECCSTAGAQTAEGEIVAYRGRTAGEIRNIEVARFDGKTWSAPAVVSNDGWKIDACPINGPAIAARGRDVAVAWFNGKSEPGHAFVALSHDAGHTFGQPVRVDDAASQGRLGVQLLDDGTAAVSWIESGSGGSQFRVRVIAPGGTRAAAVTIANAEGSRYPRIALDHGELLFAWTESGKGDATQVRTARAKLTGN